MKIRFWGVRGDIPCPGPQTMKYGGNTMCIEIRLMDPERLIIVDAGSGIRELGNYLIANDLSKGPIKADIFLTHTHWDHIQGLPCFAPLYTPGTKIRIFGPCSRQEETLYNVIDRLFQYDYFQINDKALSVDIEYIETLEGNLDLGYEDVKVTTKYLNHTILCLGYRFEYNGKVVCTAYDTEPFQNLSYLPPDDPAYDEASFKEGEKIATELNGGIMDFFSGADLLIHDAQYTAVEYYDSKIGSGHTPIEYAIIAAKRAHVKNLALIHHEPLYSDNKLDELSEKYCDPISAEGMQALFAREGMEITF